MITKQVKLLKLAKGYKAGKPALVEFDTLVSLFEERNGLAKELSEVLEENQKLREQLKKERRVNDTKERSWLEKLKNLGVPTDKANKSAGNSVLADLQCNSF